MKGWCAKIVEGKTRLELMHNTKEKQGGFIVNDNDNEENDDQEIPFL